METPSPNGHDNFDDLQDDLDDFDDEEQPSSPEELQEANEIAKAVHKLLERDKDILDKWYPEPKNIELGDGSLMALWLRYIQPHEGQPEGTYHPEKSDWIDIDFDYSFLTTNEQPVEVSITTENEYTNTRNGAVIEFPRQPGRKLSDHQFPLIVELGDKVKLPDPANKLEYLKAIEKLISSVTVQPQHPNVAIHDPYKED